VRVLNEREVSAVFHLGAQTIVGTALRAPLATFDANIRGTYALLEAYRSLGEGAVERIVVTSTDKAYGAHDELPYREDFAVRASYPCDVSKACVDLIAHSYAVTYPLPVASRASRTSTAPATSNGRGSCPTRRERSCAASGR
jgi:CDP-glucose 4,6-dehydratase